MYKRITLIILIVAVTPTMKAQPDNKGSLFSKSYVLGKMKGVANWQLHQWDSAGFKQPLYDWTYVPLPMPVLWNS